MSRSRSKHFRLNGNSSEMYVRLDRRNRIKSFFGGPSKETIGLSRIGEYLNGNERVDISGNSYRVTPNGQLIESDLEVPDSVRLASGVLLGRNVEFVEANGYAAKVGPRTSIRNAKIIGDVSIGSHVSIRGAELSDGVNISDYVLIGSNVSIGERTNIGRSSRIGSRSFLGEDVTVGDDSRIGPASTLLSGVELGPSAQVGVVGDDNHNVEDGPLLTASQNDFLSRKGVVIER